MPSSDLAGIAQSAAAELQELAHAITRTIDTLPRNTSRGTVELLQQHARRALAIAAALRVEERAPDGAIVTALLAARKAIFLGVLAVLTTVGIGFGEEVGADAYESLKTLVERSLDDDAETATPPFPGEYLRRLRRGADLTQAALGQAVGISPQRISRFETYAADHDSGELAILLGHLADRLGQPVNDLYRQLPDEARRALASPLYQRVRESADFGGHS